MRVCQQLIGVLILLNVASAFDAKPSEAPGAPSADSPTAAPTTQPAMPDLKYFPQPHYPPALIVKHVEAQVLAHIRIDDKGRAVEAAMDNDPALKPFVDSASDWLHDVRFKVPKGWSASASPVYDILFVYVICPDRPAPSNVKPALSVVVTGCSAKQWLDSQRHSGGG